MAFALLTGLGSLTVLVFLVAHIIRLAPDA